MTTIFLYANITACSAPPPYEMDCGQMITTIEPGVGQSPVYSGESQSSFQLNLQAIEYSTCGPFVASGDIYIRNFDVAKRSYNQTCTLPSGHYSITEKGIEDSTEKGEFIDRENLFIDVPLEAVGPAKIELNVNSMMFVPMEHQVQGLSGESYDYELVGSIHIVKVNDIICGNNSGKYPISIRLHGMESQSLSSPND